MNKQQLASRIWEAANAMRSKIEANDYKDYILGFIFYKFLSGKQEQFLLDQGVTRADLAEYLTEEDADTVKYVQDNLGYFIAYENLYSTWLARGADFNVGDVRDALSAFDRLVASGHRPLFNGIFDTLRTGLSNLGDSAASQTKAVRDLLNLIRDIPMDGRQGYDVLGFIYEFLIEKFAANAGKKAGEFYTPHEVSVLMSEIIAQHLAGRPEIRIYDPTSGSGSLLLNIGQEVARQAGDRDQIKYFAQELKKNTYNLTRMNLVMRGIRPDNIVTRNGDSLDQDWPMFDNDDPATYHPLYVDAVVSNPPYSAKWEPAGKQADPRFSRFGLAPDNKADYAFLLHDLFHVKPDGLMTIVLPHGVLFRGGSEGGIRKALIEENHIDAIIGLPAGIFFGTGIPTVIMVLKQRRDRDDVLFIDASLGFKKVGKNNQLRASDIRRVADAVEKRVDVERFARVVTREEVRENDYNLNIPRYVSAAAPAEPVDLYATMFGGVPESELDSLTEFWEVLPGLRERLFVSDGQGYARLAGGDLHEIIDSHPSVAAFRDCSDQALSGFDEALSEKLVLGRHDVDLLATEDALTLEVFDRFEAVPLVDSFEAYQLLFDQWAGISTDLEVIQREGEEAIRQVDPVMVIKTKNKKKVEEQDGWEGRVVPFELVQAQLLPKETAAVARLAEELTALDDELSSMFEGFSEDDLVDLSDVLNARQDAFAKGELNKAVRALTKSGLTYEDDSLEATQIRAKAILDQKTKLAKDHQTAMAALEAATHQAIYNLTREQIDELLRAKWVQPLVTQLLTMPSTVLRRLENSLKAMTDKYEVDMVGLETDMRETEANLSVMLGALTGAKSEVEGLQALQGLLGGSDV